MPTGRSADGRYAAGARRTVDMTPEAAWSAWAEAKGLGRWLSQARTPLKEGERTTMKDGTEVLAVRVRPPALLRIRLSHANWPHPRTAQLRTLRAATGTTVALHVEGLPDAASRADILERWHEALSDAGPEPTKSPARADAKKKASAKAAVPKKAATKKPRGGKTATKKPLAAKATAKKARAGKTATKKPLSGKTATKKRAAR